MQVSTAMLTWLRTFDMDAKLLAQLIRLKERTLAATGKGLFSGARVCAGG